MPGFCRPRRPPDRRAGQRTLANRPVGTGAPAPPRRAIRACALRASADGPRLRTRFPASAGGSRPPAPNPPALRRPRPRAPPPGDSRPRPSSIRRRPPPAHPIPASAGGSRPPAPNPPALRRTRPRAPSPGDSRPRPSSIRRRPRLRTRSPHRLAVRARPESPRASANPPVRPAPGRFAPAPFEHPPTAPACAPDSPHRLAVRARPPRILPRSGELARAPPPSDSRPRPSSIRRRPRLRTRFPASAGGSRPPAPDPPALRRTRLRAPPPGDSRRRAVSRSGAVDPLRAPRPHALKAQNANVAPPSAARNRKSRADAPQGRRGLRIGESARRPQGRCAERRVVQTHVWKFTRRGSPQLRSPRRGADPARGFPDTDRRRRVLRARMPDRGPQAGGA